MNQNIGMSSFPLKVTAIVAMTCNHAAYIFSGQLPFGLYCLLTGIGGLTFPIMAFLLAEGFRHTSNVQKYAMRLALFAVISQVPYWLFLDHQGNVLITLLVGLILLQLHATMKNRSLFWAIAILVALLSEVCDWGFIGVIMILIAGTMTDTRKGALYSALLPFASFAIVGGAGVLGGNLAELPTLLYGIGCGIASGLLCLYNGKRGRSMKWFFYAYYPAHIATLGVTHLLVFG